ncbi:MAG: preprotein translocase subunit SecE [Polyangiaceae bacterium]|nr:preprotein translocase subunit SecE [Polyangiaceae bacterium]
MTTDEKDESDKETAEGTPSDADVASSPPEAAPVTRPADEAEEDDSPAAAQLGASRYVLAGFFATAIAAAFVLGKVLSAGWTRLAEARWALKSAPFLARMAEEERAELCTAIGAVVAIGGAIYAYRRPDVRQWTDDVASELSKVSWPDKHEVTSNTIIVIVSSTAATVYLALLDRFWGFVTNLVYGSLRGAPWPRSGTSSRLIRASRTR